MSVDAKQQSFIFLKKKNHLTIRVDVLGFLFLSSLPPKALRFALMFANVLRGCTNSSENDRQIPEKLNCLLVTGPVVTTVSR